jgi:hypothetical protein
MKTIKHAEASNINQLAPAICAMVHGHVGHRPVSRVQTGLLLCADDILRPATITACLRGPVC